MDQHIEPFLQETFGKTWPKHKDAMGVPYHCGGELLSAPAAALRNPASAMATTMAQWVTNHLLVSVRKQVILIQ